MSFPYHGNYVGPGWSAGKYQSSVVDSSVPAIDEFDEAARKHDAAYFNHQDNLNRARADWDFVHDTKNLGFKAQLARSAVALQALGRDTYTYMTNKKNKNGGKAPQKKKKSKKPKMARPGPKRRAAPVTRGRRISSNQLVSNNTNVKTFFRSQSSGMTARCQGCELLGTVTVSSTDSIGKILFYNNVGPQFLSQTRIQAFSGLFEKYKYRSCRLVLRSKASNSTNGSVIAFFERDVSEPQPAASQDSARRNCQAWGASDIPVKQDGVAHMKRVPDENPYFTDLGSSPSDPTFGQAIAYVQLNSTGASVTSSSLTTHDVLLEYDCDFWIPQLQNEVILFYTFTNTTGTGVTTSALLGTSTSIEEAGNLEGASFDGAATVTLTLRYGHYYQVLYTVNGATVAGCQITLPGTLTLDEGSTSNASFTSNNVVKVFHLASSAPGQVQTVSLTLSATTITTPTFASFDVIDFGEFNTANPVAGPNGVPATSKWYRGRKNKTKKDGQQDDRLLALERELQKFRSLIENGTFATPQLPPTPLPTIEAMDPCKYCGDPDPDHLGRDCPDNPKNRKRSVSASPSTANRN